MATSIFNWQLDQCSGVSPQSFALAALFWPPVDQRLDSQQLMLQALQPAPKPARHSEIVMPCRVGQIGTDNVLTGLPPLGRLWQETQPECPHMPRQCFVSEKEIRCQQQAIVRASTPFSPQPASA